MTRSKPICTAAVAACILALSATASAQYTLTAVRTAQAPKLDALAADPAWKAAPELRVKLDNGANFANGATEVGLRALYSGDTLYMLVQYADPTQSMRRSPFV